MKGINFVIATSDSKIAKEITVGANGQLIKSVRNSSSGFFEHCQVNSLHEFNEVCDQLNGYQCIILGKWRGSKVGDKVKYNTLKHLENVIYSDKPEEFKEFTNLTDFTGHTIARSNLFFEYFKKDEKSLMVIDFDEYKDKLSKEEFLNTIKSCLPELKDVDILIRDSSSSRIKDQFGVFINDKVKFHAYVVGDGALQMKIKEHLKNKYIGNGLTWSKKGKNGRNMDRFLSDVVIYSPCWLYFETPMTLPNGYSQCRESCVYPSSSENKKEFLDDFSQLSDFEKKNIERYYEGKKRQFINDSLKTQRKQDPKISRKKALEKAERKYKELTLKIINENTLILCESYSPEPQKLSDILDWMMTNKNYKEYVNSPGDFSKKNKGFIYINDVNDVNKATRIYDHRTDTLYKYVNLLKTNEKVNQKRIEDIVLKIIFGSHANNVSILKSLDDYKKDELYPHILEKFNKNRNLILMDGISLGDVNHSINRLCPITGELTTINKYQIDMIGDAFKDMSFNEVLMIKLGMASGKTSKVIPKLIDESLEMGKKTIIQLPLVRLADQVYDDLMLLGYNCCVYKKEGKKATLEEMNKADVLICVINSFEHFNDFYEGNTTIIDELPQTLNNLLSGSLIKDKKLVDRVFSSIKKIASDGNLIGLSADISNFEVDLCKLMNTSTTIFSDDIDTLKKQFSGKTLTIVKSKESLINKITTNSVICSDKKSVVVDMYNIYANKTKDKLLLLTQETKDLEAQKDALKDHDLLDSYDNVFYSPILQSGYSFVNKKFKNLYAVCTKHLTTLTNMQMHARFRCVDNLFLFGNLEEISVDNDNLKEGYNFVKNEEFNKMMDNYLANTDIKDDIGFLNKLTDDLKEVYVQNQQFNLVVIEMYKKMKKNKSYAMTLIKFELGGGTMIFDNDEDEEEISKDAKANKKLLKEIKTKATKELINVKVDKNNVSKLSNEYESDFKNNNVPTNDKIKARMMDIFDVDEIDENLLGYFDGGLFEYNQNKLLKYTDRVRCMKIDARDNDSKIPVVNCEYAIVKNKMYKMFRGIVGVKDDEYGAHIVKKRVWNDKFKSKIIELFSDPDIAADINRAFYMNKPDMIIGPNRLSQIKLNPLRYFHSILKSCDIMITFKKRKKTVKGIVTHWRDYSVDDEYVGLSNKFLMNKLKKRLGQSDDGAELKRSVIFE